LVNPDRGHLARLFEGAPRFLDRLGASAPFEDETVLFATARAIAHAMPEPEQIELIDAHPRLGAPPRTLSALSFIEQGYGRVAAAEVADGELVRTHAQWVAEELGRLNEAYEARFGFRYCVFVAGRSHEALLPALASALSADRTSEIHRALDAVVDIAVDRHAKLSAGTPSSPS
jgi:2-oxo-4-hydroxy-4-carboxy-5-ureidoimidazoline decarboxylase